jgi:hypothetical protein
MLAGLTNSADKQHGVGRRSRRQLAEFAEFAEFPVKERR